MSDYRQEDVEAELARAEEMLSGLKGETVEALSVNSLEARDAPFLGLIVSKLSPIIGNLLEKRIVQLLSEADTEHGLRWVRQDPGFPDALLVSPSGSSTNAGYEVKAWYALSTEITGRFRESQNLLAGKDVRLVLVAWMMSHVVYGQPVILDVLSSPALSVAEARDRHYHHPPKYLIVEPGDTTTRTSNLRQTNVNGYRLQESGSLLVMADRDAAAKRLPMTTPPNSASAQELARELMNKFPYRLDTNFAKIDRIEHAGIETFKTRVLGGRMRGKTLSQWARLLRDLGVEGASQEAAVRAIQAVYDELR